MGIYHIKPIESKHNEEMLNILRSSPITTDNLTICFDRQPDFFRLANIKYHPHYYYGFFRHEALKGFGMLGYHQAIVNGLPETVFHLKDYYVSLDARGLDFVRKTSELFFKETYNHASIGYTILMVGNKDPHSYIGYSNPSYPYIPFSRTINQLDSRNILLTFPVKLSRTFAIRKATIKDVPAIVNMLNTEHKQRLFGNIYKEETFEEYLANRPGLTIDNYYLATAPNGKLCGVCAVWDCTSFKQTRVLHYGKRFRLTRIAHRILAMLFQLPPLPLAGMCFKDFVITDYAVSDRAPDIMNALLRAVYKEYKLKGYQNMIWGSSADDPLLKATKGFFYQRVVSDIVLISTDKSKLDNNTINTNLPYIDIPCL